MIPLSDNELLGALADGRDHVLEEIYDRHSTLLYTTILRITEEPLEAQDLLHDLFISLPGRARSFTPGGENHGICWLLTTARHLALDRVRRDKRRREILLESAADLSPKESISAPERYWDELKILHKCVGTLSGEQKSALELAYFGGLTQEEISQRLSTPLGTIKARIRRGLMRVKSCLEKEGA